jgi:hypothetical protein
MDEKKHSELSRFFTLHECNMSEYDRQRNYNILENYKVLHSLGKSVQQHKFNAINSGLFKDT